ncbi:MAG TPA: DUF5069 domain-containing protein [Candidatus Tyrphobacter sp.]
MVRDLREGPPRRWNDSLGQIRWLPRLIDKTRAALAGQLGDYLFGQSPMDRGLLRALGIAHREFARIVRDAPDDADVLAALAARTPEGIRAARAWSETLPRRHGLFLFVIDLDDGYLPGPWRLAGAPVRLGSRLLTRAVKRIWPSRALDGLRVEEGNEA